MSHRARYVAALAHARATAFRDGEHVGQESFMSADEIVALAVQAGISRETEVLDLCCGVAGPGNHVTRSTGCRLLGLDRSEDAIALARATARAEHLQAEFAVADLPPIPLDSSFDAVLMLETMLAFEDKPALLAEVARLLRAGGRLAMTFEEGLPLTPAERSAMPDGDGIWITPFAEMMEALQGAGLTVRWHEDHTQEHCDLARRLRDAFHHEQAAIARDLGAPACHAILVAHDRWVEWLGSRRVRKFALVATR